MSATTAVYSASMSNDLPSLHDSSTKFDTHDGLDAIHKLFHPLFVKHGLLSKLGVGRVHIHFKSNNAEKLVELNDLSTTWDVPEDVIDNTDKGTLGGKVLPCAWALTKHKNLVPYEFYFFTHGKDEDVAFSTAVM